MHPPIAQLINVACANKTGTPLTGKVPISILQIAVISIFDLDLALCIPYLSLLAVIMLSPSTACCPTSEGNEGVKGFHLLLENSEFRSATARGTQDSLKSSRFSLLARERHQLSQCSGTQD
eukprot:scaffold92217_cov68-Cyclotella_meneghiniana.AAC.2